MDGVPGALVDDARWPSNAAGALAAGQRSAAPRRRQVTACRLFVAAQCDEIADRGLKLGVVAGIDEIALALPFDLVNCDAGIGEDVVRAVASGTSVLRSTRPQSSD